MIYNETPRKFTHDASKFTISWINALGAFLGLVASNIWDFIAGGFVIAGIFGAPIDLGGFQVNHLVVGAIISLALWAIQLLLWKYILTGGIEWKDVPAILLAVGLAIADTNGDTAALFIWTANGSPILDSLATVSFGAWNVAEIVTHSLVIALYILGGFGELFNALYFRAYINPEAYQDEPVRKRPPAPKPILAARPKAPGVPLPTFSRPQAAAQPIPNAGPAPTKRSSLADLIGKNTKIGGDNA